jgi:hypothetical protein
MNGFPSVMRRCWLSSANPVRLNGIRTDATVHLVPSGHWPTSSARITDSQKNEDDCIESIMGLYGDGKRRIAASDIPSGDIETDSPLPHSNCSAGG